MKLYDTKKIIPGLIIFLAITTFPIWYNIASGTATYKPEPKIVTDAEQCVAEKNYMREFHMDLLNNWRDEVVRSNDRYFLAPDGKQYEKSLSSTCMKCHYNKSDFCNKCHDFVGVDPYCWECHIEPEEVN